MGFVMSADIVDREDLTRRLTPKGAVIRVVEEEDMRPAMAELMMVAGRLIMRHGLDVGSVAVVVKYWSDPGEEALAGMEEA